jgi:hypothetical protein
MSTGSPTPADARRTPDPGSVPVRRDGAGLWPLLALGAVLALVATASPAAAGHIPDTAQNVSEPIEAGQWYGIQVELPEPGKVVFSGYYDGIETDHAVVPTLLVADRLGDDDLRMYGSFLYPERPSDGASVSVRSTAANENTTTYNRTAEGRGVEVATNLAAGTYEVFVATMPAGGDARANIWIPGSATVQGSDVGASIYARGLDESPVAWDVFTRSPGVPYARSWGYSGADVPFTVQETFHGWMGLPVFSESRAYWVAPDGDSFQDRFVESGQPGEWTAAFPAEQHQGPVCSPGGVLCGPTPVREDPPFALGIDDTLDVG